MFLKNIFLIEARIVLLQSRLGVQQRSTFSFQILAMGLITPSGSGGSLIILVAELGVRTTREVIDRVRRPPDSRL